MRNVYFLNVLQTKIQQKKNNNKEEIIFVQHNLQKSCSNNNCWFTSVACTCILCLVWPAIY